MRIMVESYDNYTMMDHYREVLFQSQILRRHGDRDRGGEV